MCVMFCAEIPLFACARMYVRIFQIFSTNNVRDVLCARKTHSTVCTNNQVNLTYVLHKVKVLRVVYNIHICIFICVYICMSITNYNMPCLVHFFQNFVCTCGSFSFTIICHYYRNKYATICRNKSRFYSIRASGCMYVFLHIFCLFLRK